MRYVQCGFALVAMLTAMPALAQDNSLEDLERRLEAAKKAQTTQQAEATRKAEAARRADASRATIVVKADGDCALSVNGDSLGRLTANKTRTVKVNAGEQLIECEAADGQRVETTERLAAGEQKVLRLSLSSAVETRPTATSSDGRFSAVADGVRDTQQGVVWARRDNGSDVNWSEAGPYCRTLGPNWSLPTVAQLQSIYDSSGQYSKTLTLGSLIYTVKPATSLIDLTGFLYWSSESNGSSEAWFVYLINGVRDSYGDSFSLNRRSLCVRRS